MDFTGYDLIVIGAGLDGPTIAERAADVPGRKACVREPRPQIGGNSYREADPEPGFIPGGRLASRESPGIHRAIGVAPKTSRGQVAPFFGRSREEAA